MTTPIQVNPGDLHNYASNRRMEAIDAFSDAPPPPAPPDPDDPTRDAQHNLNQGVDQTNKGFKDRSTRTADTVDASGHAFTAQDQENAQNVAAVAPKDQTAIFTGVLKDVTSTLTGALQSLTSAAGAALSSGTSALGAGVSAAVGTAAAGAKMAPTPTPVGGNAGVAPGASVGGGAGAGGGEDEKKQQTKPASASGTPSSLAPVHATMASHNTSFDQQMPQTGAMPMGMGGLGGLAGAPSSSVSKTKTAKIITAMAHSDDDEPDTLEFPVIAVPVVHVPSPFKDKDGLDT